MEQFIEDNFYMPSEENLQSYIKSSPELLQSHYKTLLKKRKENEDLFTNIEKKRQTIKKFLEEHNLNIRFFKYIY